MDQSPSQDDFIASPFGHQQVAHGREVVHVEDSAVPCAFELRCLFLKSVIDLDGDHVPDVLISVLGCLSDLLCKKVSESTVTDVSGSVEFIGALFSSTRGQQDVLVTHRQPATGAKRFSSNI